MSTTPVLPRPSSPQSTMTARSGSASSALNGHRSAVRSNRSTVPTELMYATKTIADAVDRSQPTLIPHRLQLPAQHDVQQWLERIAGLYRKAANQ